ncbi:MAG: hypothetical protein ACHQ51_00730 [Elusimicrobiota bacterium]
MRRLSLAAGLTAFLAVIPVWTAAQRVGETVVAPVPGNMTSGVGASVAAPAASLAAGPAALAAPGAFVAPSAAVAPAPLAPALAAPAPLAAALVAPTPAAPAAPAAPMAALRDTGKKIDAARQHGDAAAAPAALDAMFEGSAAKAETAMIDGRVAALSARLEKSSPRTSEGRRMPPGVKIAFQKSLVMGGGMAALFAGLWPMLHAMAPSATFAQYAALAAPLAILPLHFALVSAFWAGRYYLYPKLGDSGKTAFRAAWSTLAPAYPVAALVGLGAWTALLAGQTALLALFGAPALLAAAEVIHHFVYRVTPERAQDKGKPLTDWRGRIGGNIGQQLKRMKRRGG